MDDLIALLGTARGRLAGMSRARLGAVRAPGRLRRILGARPVIAPVSEAWHVGVLLIGDEDLWATGSVLRASEEVRRGYTAEAQRERAALRGMAFRGGFAEGETFHLDWTPIDARAIAAGGSSAPLAWDGERLMVRWSPAGFLMRLEEYLDEQIRLLET